MQPTASSTPASLEVDRRRAPTECERSQTTCASWRRATSVIAAHVGQRARAVGDVGEHDERGGAVGERAPRASSGCGPCERVGLEQPQLEAALGAQALEHVAVGREVAAVGDDRALRAQPVGVERGGAELVQVHRRRVADEHLARPRAEHAVGEHVAGLRAAGRSTRASRRRAASPTASSDARRGARAWPAAAARASCRRGRSASGSPIAKRVAEAAPAGRRRRAPRRAPRSVTAMPSHRAATAGCRGSMCPMWSSLGRTSGRRRRRPPAPPRRTRGSCAAGTMSSSPPWITSCGHAERQRARAARRRRVVRALVRRAAEQLVDDAVREPAAARPRARSSTPACATDAGHARHGAGRPRARWRAAARSAGGRRPSGRSADDAVELQRRVELGQRGRCRRRRPRTSPASRRRCRAGGTRGSRPSSRARGEVVARRSSISVRS